MTTISHQRLVDENEMEIKKDGGRPYRRISSILQVIGGVTVFAVGVLLAFYPIPDNLYRYRDVPRGLEYLKVGIWMGLIIAGTGLLGLLAAKKPVIGLYMGLSLMTAALSFTGTGLYAADVVILQNQIGYAYRNPEFSGLSCLNESTRCYCFVVNDYDYNCKNQRQNYYHNGYNTPGYQKPTEKAPFDCAQVRKDFEVCLDAMLHQVYPLNLACFFILGGVFFIVGIASIFGACNSCIALCRCTKSKKTNSTGTTSRNIACNIYCCGRTSGMSYTSLPFQPQTIEAVEDGADKPIPVTPYISGVEVKNI